MEGTAAIHDHSHGVATHINLFLALINGNVAHIKLWNRDLVLLREEASKIVHRRVEQSVCIDGFDLLAHLLSLVLINSVPVGTGKQVVFSSQGAFFSRDG